MLPALCFGDGSSASDASVEGVGQEEPLTFLACTVNNSYGWSGETIGTAKPAMTNEVLDFAALTVGIAILAFLWNLHRDVANLRERMARLEGLLEGFTQTGKPPPTQP